MHGVWNRQPDLSFADRCAVAFETLSEQGFSGSDARILAITPFFQTNPYQRMLYAEAISKGFAVLPVRKLSELLEVEDASRIVLHHHWVQDVFAKRSWQRGAMKAAEDYLAKLRSLKRKGITTVWTVHNIMSHQSVFPDAERALRSGLADVADCIHIMNGATADMCRPYYELDERKVFRVPHPSYKGVYADYVTRGQARISLGIAPEETVLLLFGSIENYKGTVTFLERFEEIRARFEGKLSVLVAGRDGKDEAAKKVRAIAKSKSASVHLYMERIREQDIQTFFRAADVAVCAHKGGLNSGVMATALTFGRPVVAASHLTGCLQDTEGLVFDFDHDDPESLFEACRQAKLAGASSQFEATAINWSEAQSPQQVSAQFFDALAAHL